MPLFNAFADVVKEWLCTGGSWTLPTSIKVLLSSTVPLADGTNITIIGAGLTNPVVEAVGTGNWALSSAGSGTSNSNLLDFGTATGSATVNAVILRDHLDGNIAFLDISGSPISISNGDPVQAAIGAIEFQINAGATGDWFDYLVDMLINAMFRGAALTQPTSLSFGFSTTTPSADGTGITEPGGAWYSQQSLAANGTNFDNAFAAGDPCTNLVAMSFGNSDETVAITHIVMYDHAANKLAFDPWSKTIQNGQPVSIEIGQISNDFD